MRRRGLDPQDLYLSLQLEPDKSVVFGSPWTNSLGIKLVPVGGNALVMTHEVRVKDFQEIPESYRKESSGPARLSPGRRPPGGERQQAGCTRLRQMAYQQGAGTGLD